MKRLSATALVFLSLLVPILLALTPLRIWWERELFFPSGKSAGVHTIRGYDEAYGWIVLGCAVAYLALCLFRRRYSVLIALVLSLGSLASVIAARQHYQGFGHGETTRALSLALLLSGIWVAQSILVLVFSRGARTSGLSETAYVVGRLWRGISMPPLDIRRVLTFRTMLAPWLIRALFIIGVVAFAIGGALLIGDGLRATNWGETAKGVGVLLLGPILVRLVCEYSILFFRMNETLNDIAASLEPSATATASSSPPTKVRARP